MSCTPGIVPADSTAALWNGQPRNVSPGAACAVESGEQTLAWRLVVAGLDHGVGDALLHAAQVFLHHRRLAWEMLVERTFGDRRLGGQSFDTGGIDAVAVEQLSGGVQDALARASATLRCRGLPVHARSIPNGLHSASSVVLVAAVEVHLSVY